MTIILSIVLAVVGYFVLMYITTNLIGMVVRGFFRDANLEKMKTDNNVSIFIKKHNRADDVTTIVFVIISILFFYLLYRYLNIWAVFAALLLTVGRIPDLLWEIKHGQKTTMENMRRGPIDIATSIMDWLALPVIWWSLYTLLI